MGDEKVVDWSKIQAALAAPFPASDIEWRIGQAGWKDGRPWAKVLAYLTNRAIMQRLDDVVGCQNWENAYVAGPQGGVLCGIGIHGIVKWDGADNTQIEAVKGGLSDSMKRAAVQWGMGRYLYQLPSTFADCSSAKKGGDAWRYQKVDGKPIWWKIPSLPAEFLPAGDTSVPQGAGGVEPADAPAKKEKTPPPAALMDEKACLDAVEKASSKGHMTSIFKAHDAKSRAEGWNDALVGLCQTRAKEFDE